MFWCFSCLLDADLCCDVRFLGFKFECVVYWFLVWICQFVVCYYVLLGCFGLRVGVLVFSLLGGCDCLLRVFWFDFCLWC